MGVHFKQMIIWQEFVKFAALLVRVDEIQKHQNEQI